MADQVLLKGVRLFRKKDNQPDFVIAGGAITLNELFTFAKENPHLVTEYDGKKQIKIQVKKSKEGNPYIEVDTWKPDGSKATAPPIDKDPVDDLPF